MNNFIELPSKLNSMSLEELETEEPSHGIILSYLDNDRTNMIAMEIANSHITSEIMCVMYNRANKNWVCRRKLKGKMVIVKQSTSRENVEAAAIEFAKKNNLKVYR